MSHPPAYPSGTRDLTDDEFVTAFESLTLGDDRFRHYDHVRLAWIFVRGARDAGAFARATERIATGIRRFARHHGGAAKYHETITRAYMRLVAAHVRRTPDISAFDVFATMHPDLMDKHLPRVYYSEALLSSVSAREQWVDPDITPLPEIAAL